MGNKRIADLGKILNAECGKYENDCSKCPYKKECEEYSKIYQELEK